MTLEKKIKGWILVGTHQHEHQPDMHGFCFSDDPLAQVKPLGITEHMLPYGSYFIYHLPEYLEFYGLNNLPFTGKYSWGK